MLIYSQNWNWYFFPFWICNFTVQYFLILCSSQNYIDYKIISLLVLFFSLHSFEILPCWCFYIYIYFCNWETADHPSENIKFSITGVALSVAFLLKWYWQSNYTNQDLSFPPLLHADSSPCLHAALFFLPGWWMVATKQMLHNQVGSKGGWSC